MKKLLLLYWEVVEKLKVDGEVKDEIILACNALRKDLLSPNEFVRGRTLRLVAKIPIESIMENLVQAVNDNLVHRHYYVRRNAVMTLYAIFKNFGAAILEESDEKIESLLQQETDLSTRRNAFLLLFNLNREKALTYLRTLMTAEDPLSEMGDVFQLIVLEMLTKLCKEDSSQKSRLMNAIFMLSQSKSSSVLFECANTITQLTTAPNAIKVAIQSYLSLLSEQNDNNIKMIVLGKIVRLKKNYSRILEDYTTDILSIVTRGSSTSIEINKQIVELITELAS